ncbi:MAG: uracil-DNA glycosylase [Gammaproteobacteria bacterium]|nr:uracil-DNA glycosylase [Gammaproteobacteria bacterium]
MPPDTGGAPGASFRIDCRRCPRLAEFLSESRRQFPGYHSRPVPSFGDAHARLLIVGLAPGLHGANATGRPFTGDFAGILLYRTLFDFGFSSHPQSRAADDELRLRDCRITNAVRCVPPQNKPVAAEVRTCNGYLREEIAGLPPGALVMALGNIAHGAVLRATDRPAALHPFGHGRLHALNPGLRLIDSYHCSRYNTQTRRLTAAMFTAVFARARAMLDE